ncbi:SDR family oxidoreductase [Alkalibacterium sp. 20]|uniref:SDR family oxidoreductase n=1 Tax=Alkalibacterium sp. 20 TaxID=1798803 RepID=UPI0008FFE996|nr:SDR family oxidoreductase [Alkalibacterium sp. 20]OJF95341.1 NAD(P)-dependent oxidoreductase [Alkalibacterium sp. 20]
MHEKEIVKTQQPKENYLMADNRKNIKPLPKVESDSYKAAGKMKGFNTIVTGADSGIGLAVAIAFAKEGANVALVDLKNNEDLKTAKKRIKKLGVKCLTFAGDVGDEDFAKHTVNAVAEEWEDIHVLVNNAAEQHSQESIMDITAAQIDRTFRTNIYSTIYWSREVFPYLVKGGAIINSSSVTAYKGSPGLMDYASTKGAIISFTRSLAQNKEFLKKKIRVNAVAPGPIWTPLIPATLGSSYEEHAGVPMDRPGEPYELAPTYVYLATNDSSYVTGQTLHVNGGTVVNG